MAAFFDFMMPDEEDDEESREQKLEYAGKDCLLFLVDCSSVSFSKPEDGVTPFHLIAKVLREFLNRKSVKCEKDYVSIVFYGTKLLANSLDVDNVYVYHPLGLPNVDLITDLDQWISGNAKTEIETKYGIADTYSLSDTIWVCSRILREVKFKVADYHVVLFTPEDNPHGSNNDLRKKALKRFEDLFSFAQFDIIPLKKNFDISKFYEQLRDACDDKFGEGNMFRISDPLVSANLADLSDVLDKKLQPKRSLGSIIFNIGPDVPLGINIYSLIGSQRVPPKTPVRKNDYKEVKGIRQDLRKETRDELLDIDIKLAQTYGGMQIAFEQMEIKDLRTYGAAGMSLIGFKPRSMLKPNYHVRSSQFIYPNDKLVEGSNQLFLALLTKCLERDVVPVCKLISRSNAAPRLVYLLPQAEDKPQGVPCGFHVIFMPFADDIRSLSNIIAEDQPRADDEQTNKAKEVVKALKFSYKPENFNNPALHKFYNTIESFALSRDSVAPVIDPTIPKCEDMDRKAGAAIAEFKSAVFPENYQPPAKKRPAAASNGASKVNNVEEGGVTDWRAHAQSGTLTKFTVPQLKAAANEVGVKLTATRKLDIIDQLAAHFK